MSEILLSVFFSLVILTVLIQALGTIFLFPEKRQIRLFLLGLLNQSLLLLSITFYFFWNHCSVMHTRDITLFKSPHYDFIFSLQLDSISLTMMWLTCFFVNIIAFFARRYMHREPGVQRFFLLISFFVLGMYLTLLSPTLSLLFTGWEIVGISSYLLIAFYWEREKAVFNAEYIYWIYQISDLGFLQGAFFANISSLHTFGAWCTGILILLTAFGKSAQFPFLTWLPRALEGPTPSSALFYGALSIHLGPYLLLRTEPVWRTIHGFSLLLGILGAFSGILAYLLSLSRSTIKGKIAYQGSSQIGIIILEIALGFPRWALFHTVAHALYRGYQLLEAPSIIVNELQLQKFKIKSRWFFSWTETLPKKWIKPLYLFVLNEACIDLFFSYMIQSFSKRKVFYQLSFLTGFVYFIFQSESFSLRIICTLVSFMLLCSVLSLHLQAIGPFTLLFLVYLSQVFGMAATLVLHPQCSQQIIACFFTFTGSFLLAWTALSLCFSGRAWGNLFRWHGLIRYYPLTGALFFLGALGLTGSPLAFTFIAEDFMMVHLVPCNAMAATLACLAYILNGASMIRLFGFLFLCTKPQVFHDPLRDHALTYFQAACLLSAFLITQSIPYLSW